MAAQDETERAGTEAGEQIAALYRAHVDAVYRYLLYRVGNRQDAEDLTAQTFLAVLQSLHTFRGEGTIGAWILGVARHKALDHLRRHRPAARQTLPIEAAQHVAADAPLLDTQLLSTLRREEVLTALAHIAPARAEAVRLRFFGELTHAEAAHLLGKSEAAVKMLVHRGLRDLRAQLAHPPARDTPPRHSPIERGDAP